MNHYFAFLAKDLLAIDGVPFDSPTLNIEILVGEGVLYLLVVYALPPGKLFSFPLAHLLFRLDNSICSYCDKNDERLDFREEIHHGDYVPKYYRKALRDWH